MDEKQGVRFAVPEVVWNSGFSLNHKKLDSSAYSANFPAILQDGSLPISSERAWDTAVFVLSNQKTGCGGEINVTIIGEVVDTVVQLYFFERSQAPSQWRMMSLTSSIEGEEEKHIEFDATFRSMRFSISEIVEFPLNEEGTYDDIVRYIRVRGEVRAYMSSRIERWEK